MKVRKIVALSVSALALAGGAVEFKHQLHISPEFHAQLVQLKESVKWEEEKAKDEQQRRLAQQEEENQRLRVEGDELDVQLAELKGQNVSAARKKLRLDQGTEELMRASNHTVESLGEMYEELGNQPPSELVYAELPAHVHTLRDWLVVRRFRAKQELNAEYKACVDTEWDKQPNHDVEKPCGRFKRQISAERDYINAATDNKL